MKRFGAAWWCDLCVCYVRHQRLLLEIGLSSWSGLHSDQSDHPTEPLQVKVGLIGMDGWVVDIIMSIDKAFSSSHQVILLWDQMTSDYPTKPVQVKLDQIFYGWTFGWIIGYMKSWYWYWFRNRWHCLADSDHDDGGGGRSRRVKVWLVRVGGATGQSALVEPAAGICWIRNWVPEEVQGGYMEGVRIALGAAGRGLIV